MVVAARARTLLWLLCSGGLAVAVLACGGRYRSDRTAPSGGAGGQSSSAGSGNAPIGGTSGTGGGASNGGAADVGGAGGAPDFCTGLAKVRYQDTVVYPGVTNYPTALYRNCCTTDTVHFHTRASLGADLEVDVTEWGGYVSPGEYPVGSSPSTGLEANLRFGTDPPLSGDLMVGTARFSGSGSLMQRTLGLCLQVTDPSSGFAGTRVFVPSTHLSFETTPFQIFLLQDPSLSAAQARTTSLDSLVLASSPLVDLSGVVFVEQATGRIGLSRETSLGLRVRDQVQSASVNGLPFVVEAGGARIYLGAFQSIISSVALPCPTVAIERMSIDGFVIDAPPSGADPRNDPRILAALDAASRLIPP